MDWIIELPESNGYTQIWVIVDRFTKMAHLIPLPTNVNATDIAKIFVKEIWKHHGLPTDIVSDRDTKITSHFWQVLMDLLGIKTKLSTAFHPETDGQTERVNQTIEQYLRHYCSWKQDDWDELLPMAEFAYNSAKSETTGMSPFEANYGMIPKQSWEPLNKTPYINPASTLLENVWKCTWERLRENILKAQVRTARWYNQKRGKQPDLKVGDLVMIDRKNLSSRRPSKKLDHKKAGPFPIIKVVGKRAYRVQLPPGSLAHPTFNVQLIEPYRTSQEPSRQHRPPSPEPIDGEENWIVRAIVDSRKNNRKKGKPVEYLVLWEGYPDEEATWEPLENIQGTAEEALKAYRDKNPNTA